MGTFCKESLTQLAACVPDMSKLAGTCVGCATTAPLAAVAALLCGKVVLVVPAGSRLAAGFEDLRGHSVGLAMAYWHAAAVGSGWFG